ncbi:substrate-binding periplasmic protein [Chitinolyticbacter meiyuanensis]|uniref:substrate-binding periplasmic protein n=1 Tax=Chitinolyticbacter meiyuanensis TaxID=682798 RepID=UPI0011E5FE20|nr:transporter substrate-binding domain-containing protein [Chitinolyticbacter meiyuanensis]
MIRLLALITGLTLLLANTATAQCSRPLRVAMEDWPPYVYRDSRGAPTGLDIELLNAIVKAAGCTLQVLDDVPRSRRHLMHQRGELDLLLAASVTDERKRYSRFTLPYRPEAVGIFARADEAARYDKLKGFDDILAQRIGLLTPNNGWYGDDYARHLSDLKASGQLQHFETFTQGMRMLKAKRAELMMGDVGAMVYEARFNVKLAIQQLPLVPNEAPVHLMLSRASTTEADLAALDAAITKLETNGTLGKLRQKYGLR